MTELGRFLKGSQNYGLDTPNSDFDWVHIYAPTFYDIYYHERPQPREHDSYWTLQYFVDRVLNMDPTALEILFTNQRYIVNEQFYTNLYQCLREEFMNGTHHYAQAHTCLYVRKMSGMIYSDIKAARKTTDKARVAKMLSRTQYFMHLMDLLVNNDMKFSREIYLQPIQDDPTLLWMKTHPQVITDVAVECSLQEAAVHNLVEELLTYAQEHQPTSTEVETMHIFEKTILDRGYQLSKQLL